MSGYEELLALADAATPGMVRCVDLGQVKALVEEVLALRERLAFSQQTTTNIMEALAESGGETEALRGKVERVEALADELDNESATDMWDQGQFYAVQLRAALGDDR